MAGSFLRYNAYRLGVALGALAWAVWRALGGGDAAAPEPVLRVVALALGLLLVVVFGVRGRAVSRPFQLFQLALDVALVSVLSEMTGGLHSLFTLLYFPTIGAGAYLMRREGALWAATFATVGFFLMLAVGSDFQPPRQENVVAVWSEAMFRVFAFYLMALLTGQLGEQLARADEELQGERESSLLLASEHDTVLDRVRAGVLSSNAQGVVVSVNPFGRALLGDVRGKPLLSIFPRVLEDGTWEERRDGGERWVCSRAMLPDGGCVIVVEDVTELARMRELASRDERMAEVGRMAASLAHEIRNPLASLSGSLQLMHEERPSRLAELALGEAERLNRLVEDFLSVSKRPSVVARPVDVFALASEVCEAFGRDPRYASKVVARCEGARTVAPADPDRLRQALWNLVLNGAQAMPRGGEIVVTVREAASHEQGVVGVEIAVEDQGVGISDADRQRVFDPFYTTRNGGTGLGLLLVEQVARGHGGHVHIQTGPSQGTAFHLWLPRETPLAS